LPAYDFTNGSAVTVTESFWNSPAVPPICVVTW